MSTPQTAAAATRQVKRLVTRAGLSPSWIRTRGLVFAHDRSQHCWTSNLCFAGSDEAAKAAEVLNANGYRIVGEQSNGMVSASIASAS